MSARTRLTLTAFLGVAALLLVYEHRAHVLTGTAVLVGLLALCVGMHLFMHRHTDHGTRRSMSEPRDVKDNR